MPKYAQINGSNIVVAISTLRDKNISPNLIEIVGEDPVMGSTWDGQSFTAPPPTVKYTDLTKVEFIDHVIANSVMDDASLVTANQDANLAAFWIRFNMAEYMARDNAIMLAGLDALISLGYITNADKSAILTNWPTA